MAIGFNAKQVIQSASVALLVSALALTGCGSNVLGNLPGTSPVTAQATLTQAMITDAPGNGILAMGLTVQSIRMLDAAGKYVDILAAPATIEATHLDGVQEPLRAPLQIPQDTYTAVVISVANPIVWYVDATTHKPAQATATLTSPTDTLTLTTPITVTATSAPIVFDLLVAQSVVLSGASATVTPTFDVRQIPLVHNPTNGGNGRMDDVDGSLVSVSGTTLTILTANGTQVAVATDASTQLQGFSTLSALTPGTLLDIDVANQPNGTLLALRIHIDPALSTYELVGPVTATTGKPVTSFSEAVRLYIGPGTAPAAGTPYTIAVSGSTTFKTAAQFGYLPTLPFTPAFTAATLFAGQNVAVGTGAVSGTSATAATITLVPQTIDGTVAAIAQAGGFSVSTVTLASGSTLGALTGATTVTVYSNGSTQFQNSGPLVVGSTVRFNGLLFNDAGTLRMLSGACLDGEGHGPPQHR